MRLLFVFALILLFSIHCMGMEKIESQQDSAISQDVETLCQQRKMGNEIQGNMTPKQSLTLAISSTFLSLCFWLIVSSHQVQPSDLAAKRQQVSEGVESSRADFSQALLLER